MRRKRLQHVADTLCHMFCGWRLIEDKPRLVELGNGTLDIDALVGDCYFDSAPISPMGIALELRGWLLHELAAHSIPISQLQAARVRTQLQFSEIAEFERTTGGTFYVQGRSHRSVRWHRCQIACSSEVISGTDAYRSTYSDLEEWPLGWPAG